MAIPFNKYVRIISGVGGGNSVRQRDLIGRLFTDSPLVSPGVVLEFTSAADVATWFGSGSLEAQRANVYFGWVSPLITQAGRIGFSRWAEDGTDAQVIGNNDPKTIGQWAGATAGVFSLTLNGVTYSVGPVNLAGAASLAAVATALQTAVRAANAALNAATVTYGGSLGPQRFVVTVPNGVGEIQIASTTSTAAQDVATIAGLNFASSAINITGIDPQTPVDAVNAAANVTNNYGSFAFVPMLDLAEVQAVAAANETENVKFMFLQRVTQANAAAWSAALMGYASIGLVLDSAGEFPDMMPITIMAATNYNRRNSSMNYMYRTFSGMSATVSDGGISDAMDALRVNYYGATSTAGQAILFFQRGTLMGTGAAPTDMNVHANEQWLKDYAGSRIMSLQLSVGRIPANDQGRAMIGNILQEVIDAALYNGVISVGKTLTAVQKAYIGQLTGKELSWLQVQNSGFVLSVVIEPYTTTSGATEYQARYELIYSKDDVVRRVEASHILI